MTRSMHVVLEELRLEKLYVVAPGSKSYPLDKKVSVLSILELPSIAR